jgi:uncharacterized protein YggT (Ycf19 family)
MPITGRIEGSPHVIAEVGDEVERDIAAKGAVPAPGEPARIERVAANLRGAAIDDVVRTERDVAAARITGRIAQVLDYLFALVYALLGVRFLLAFLAARSGAGFTRFVTTVTDPLYAPFRNIVDGLRLGGGHVVALSIVVAVIAYGLLHLATRGLLGVIAKRRVGV